MTFQNCINVRFLIFIKLLNDEKRTMFHVAEKFNDADISENQYSDRVICLT